MVDPATIAMIRGGVLLGQIGISTVRELMAWMKESDIDLPALDEILASVELPIPGQYGMMTYLHEGKQYIVVQSGSAQRRQPGSLVALTLP